MNSFKKNGKMYCILNPLLYTGVMIKKKLVILGGGFGGINTYRSLSPWMKEHCEVTLIDKNNYFLFTPLLPEVAGGNLDNHHVVEPLRDIISKNDTFIQGTVVKVNTTEKKIVLHDRELSYDILVSTLGSETFFYGIKGADEHCYELKDLEDAMSLKSRFVEIMEQASQLPDGKEKKQLLTLVIVGGGPTGVELAGEVADLFFKTFTNQFPSLHFEDINITLVNSNPHILQMFSHRLQGYAERALQKANITLLKNFEVQEVDADGVIAKDETRIDAKTVVWTAGVSATPLECEAGNFNTERGRIVVNEFLQVPKAPETFVIGDMAYVPDPGNRGLPMTAQIAKQQGKQTAKNIENFLKGEPIVPFRYREKGLLASIGTFNAIAEIQGFYMYGFVAWFMWRTIYLFNFASWSKRFHIMADWTINLFTRRDTTRL